MKSITTMLKQLKKRYPTKYCTIEKRFALGLTKKFTIEYYVAVVGVPDGGMFIGSYKALLKQVDKLLEGKNER
ncbi:MAG: hypothetical protein GY705_13615 [Bacteroidetes bacterium]|nr:hypothetical protein [Bacteroidota bacterium]